MNEHRAFDRMPFLFGFGFRAFDRTSFPFGFGFRAFARTSFPFGFCHRHFNDSHFFLVFSFEHMPEDHFFLVLPFEHLLEHYLFLAEALGIYQKTHNVCKRVATGLQGHCKLIEQNKINRNWLSLIREKLKNRKTRAEKEAK